MLRDFIQELEKEENSKGSKGMPMPKRLVPNKSTVIKVLIPHYDPWIEGVMNKVNERYKLSQAKDEALKRSPECYVELENHINVTNEFEYLLVFILANNLPFNVGQVLAIQGGTIKMKVDRIEYHRHEASGLLVMRVYLLPFK